MTWDPSGRVAVVTGASSGIGRATTRRLARAGMTVVAVARRRDRLARLAAEHPGVVAHPTDVTDPSAVDELAAWVEEQLGACHALINNAGVPGAPFRGRGDLDDTVHTIEVNVLGTIRCTAAFAALLGESAPSRVVNVASVAGKLGIGPAGYAASKFAVVGFSEALSLSWASRGVTVCQLNPGLIVTEGFPKTRLRRSPVGRFLGRPDVVADAILDVLVRGRTERTVPRWYRVPVVARHVVPPLYRRVASRLRRAGVTRDDD